LLARPSLRFLPFLRIEQFGEFYHQFPEIHAQALEILQVTKKGGAEEG